MQAAEVKQKMATTNLERYGSVCSLNNAGVKHKRDQTWLTKYGGHPLNNQQVKNKLRSTNMDRYGVEYPLQCPNIHIKTIETYRARNGYDNPFSNPDVRDQARQRCLDRYGVDYPMKDPSVFKKSQGSAFRRYDYTFDNITFSNLQGYEKYFLKENEFDTSLIKHGLDVPTFSYQFGKTDHTYYPDFYIPAMNMIIEVKSTYTLMRHFLQNLSKMHAVLNSGYRFEFRIYDGKGRRIKFETVAEFVNEVDETGAFQPETNGGL
jgi:hypothetical protein